LRRLLLPDADTHLVEGILQNVDGPLGETAAEVPGGGRIGDALGTQSVEVVDVIAAEFEILQAIGVAQGVVGDVEDMIRLVVRQMDLEQVESAINGVNESDASCQHVKDADATEANAVNPRGHFITNVGGGEYRTAVIADNGL